MRLVRWHEDGLASFQVKWLTGNPDLRLAIQHVDEGVERGGVFAQFLAGVEGEQGHVAGFSFEDDAADDGAFLIADQVNDG